MLLARRFPGAATATLLVACSFVAASFPTTGARAQGSAGACRDEPGLAVLASPVSPWRGAPLHVIFTTEKPFSGELSLIAPDGSVAATSHDRFDGPPYSWFAQVASPAAGTWHARLTRNGAPGGCATVTREITVRSDRPAPPAAVSGSVWPIRNRWDRGMENLYSAWIEKLFDAPIDDSPSWKALHEVLRDRARNVLFNHLGLGEDEMGLVIRPDCADLPYFLRAYFAFKMGLPFGYSKCTRGGGGKPPTCFQWFSIQHLEAARAASEQKVASLAPAAGKSLVTTFGHFVRDTVANAVHSGTGRTALDDNNTDYYPIPLTQDELRPGTVYADPFGHILVLAKRIPQTDKAAGVFFAVDAQPDGTVARKRFWRGNFLFARDPALGGPGFKRFRPIEREPNGTLRRLTNAEIAKDRDYADFSLEQAKLDVEAFYDRMDDVMSPEPLDPLQAMQAAIDALDEQVHARVTSVENGRKYQTTARGESEMPDGAAIFETTGAWEDFATPARDLRLLIAIDVVRNFPDRVSRRTARYAMPKDKSVADVKAELENVLASELAKRKFSYTRSDGSSWTLALKDMVDRAGALEMGYNLNDCVELRWGAPENSSEASTCRRHAPPAQRAKMTKYRAWFHERRRPPRA